MKGRLFIRPFRQSISTSVEVLQVIWCSDLLENTKRTGNRPQPTPECHLCFNFATFPFNKCRKNKSPNESLNDSFHLYAGDLTYIYCRNDISWGIRGFDNNMILLCSCPRNPGNSLILERPEKKSCQNNICSLSGGDHDCGEPVLQFVVFSKVVSRKQIGQTALHGPYIPGKIFITVSTLLVIDRVDRQVPLGKISAHW